MTSATTGAPERSSSNDTPLTEHSSSASTDPNLKLHILVAEDDPINSQVVEKRLEKLGQAVKLTSNGEACFHAIASHEQLINIILMDIQMPLVDGINATKMIREHEAKILETQMSKPRRVPILAVSASIVERKKEVYTSAGFDGWIMKPINFVRLSILLGNIRHTHVRNRDMPLQWEGGGWFPQA